MRAAALDAPSRWRSVSVWLMPLLVASFAAQQLIIGPKAYSAYLFLSGYGMKSGHFWEILTCQGFHTSHSLLLGLGHLGVNLAGLWFLGRPLEARFGSGRFVSLALVTGTVGALAQAAVAVTGFLLPESSANTADFLIARFGESVGSSNALCGALGCYCLWKSREPLRVLWWLPVQGRHLFWLVLAVAALLVVVPSDPNLSHVGHLVGLLTGAAAYRFWLGRNAGPAQA